VVGSIFCRYFFLQFHLLFRFFFTQKSKLCVSPAKHFDLGKHISGFTVDDSIHESRNCFSDALPFDLSCFL
jgi:hypothetical protein